MQELPDISRLELGAKDALIAALWKQNQELKEQLRALKQRLNELEKRPKKTSQNSSKSPSQGFKSNLKQRSKGGERRAASIGRAGGGRRLHPHPHCQVVAKVDQCLACQRTLLADSQWLNSRYEKIELPPIARIVTRVERY